MGLRCLVGHDFDPPQTTREREDRGEEVVTTIREYRECSRCGHRRIVSENTEVKANPDPDGGDGQPGDDAEGADEPSVAEEYEDVSAAEDDGIILEDDAESDQDRRRGQWPEVDADEPDEYEHDPWPEAEGEDEGYAAEATEGDGLDDEVTFRGGGLTPERAAPEYPSGPTDDEADEMVGNETPAGIRSAETQATGQGLAGVETVFVCPECNHSELTVSSSLREGDICPECRRGYLSERPPE